MGACSAYRVPWSEFHEILILLRTYGEDFQFLYFSFQDILEMDKMEIKRDY